MGAKLTWGFFKYPKVPTGTYHPPSTQSIEKTSVSIFQTFQRQRCEVPFRKHWRTNKHRFFENHQKGYLFKSKKKPPTLPLAACYLKHSSPRFNLKRTRRPRIHHFQLPTLASHQAATAVSDLPSHPSVQDSLGGEGGVRVGKWGRFHKNGTMFSPKWEFAPTFKKLEKEKFLGLKTPEKHMETIYLVRPTLHLPAIHPVGKTVVSSPASGCSWGKR